MRECFEEGILQSYLDNELSSEMAERVAVHIAACSTCADAVTAASNETLELARAFEAEMALDVPTVVLRERIDAAIAGINVRRKISAEKPKRNLSGWLASLAGQFQLSPQRALGLAGLVVILAFAAIFAIIRSNYQPTRVADGVATAGRNDVAAVPTSTPSRTLNSNSASGPDKGSTPPDRAKPKKKSNPNIVPEPSQLPKDELAAKPLPGEMNYLKAIDSLAVEIQSVGETALKPSLRAEYERNLAVVDQAIDSTRRVARRHPNDSDAAAFLYSSYQSKLDLLSAVAEQVRPTIATR